jgi:hypothetical protein
MFDLLCSALPPEPGAPHFCKPSSWCSSLQQTICSTTCPSNLMRIAPTPVLPPSPQAREVADTAVGLLKAHNRRTLDVIAARIYFYYSWAYECLNRLADVRRWAGAVALLLFLPSLCGGCCRLCVAAG